MTTETFAAHGLPDLFEVDCLGDANWCTATWSPSPAGQATIMVTVQFAGCAFVARSGPTDGLT